MPIGGQVCNGATVRGRHILEYSDVQMPFDRNRLARCDPLRHPLALLFALRTPPERTRFRQNVPEYLRIPQCRASGRQPSETGPSDNCLARIWTYTILLP